MDVPRIKTEIITHAKEMLRAELSEQPRVFSRAHVLGEIMFNAMAKEFDCAGHQLGIEMIQQLFNALTGNITYEECVNGCERALERFADTNIIFQKPSKDSAETHQAPDNSEAHQALQEIRADQARKVASTLFTIFFSTGIPRIPLNLDQQELFKHLKGMLKGQGKKKPAEKKKRPGKKQKELTTEELYKKVDKEGRVHADQAVLGCLKLDSTRFEMEISAYTLSTLMLRNFLLHISSKMSAEDCSKNWEALIKETDEMDHLPELRKNDLLLKFVKIETVISAVNELAWRVFNVFLSESSLSYEELRLCVKAKQLLIGNAASREKGKGPRYIHH